MLQKVLFFRRFSLEKGRRIHIEDGPRKGDWEVLAVDDRKVSLRCPVSGRIVEWDRFCYFVEERPALWPSGR